MPATLPYPTLFIGDAEQAESCEIAGWLTERGAVQGANAEAAVEMVEAGFAPALIVIAELWPGQIAKRQIERLRHAAPLARIIRLQGTWLEGSLRTSKPIPGTFRIPWRQWPFRMARRLEAIELRGEQSWSQPLSASDDERLLSGGERLGETPESL
ncbi:MAG TPA: hypothetical protein VGJ15_04220, partial [Pirellulales bacterium]